MLISNPDLTNSCRVCRSPNQDGDYECLYETSSKHEEGPVLSEAGILYEHLLDISLNMWDYYPQFLCNSCDLQMKLFKKLKDKAYKTLEYLQNLYEDDMANAKQDAEQEAQQACENYEQEAMEAYEEYGTSENAYDIAASGFAENAECQGNTTNEYQANEINEYGDNAASEYQMNIADENQEQNITLVNSQTEQQEFLYTEKNLTNIMESTTATTTQETAMRLDTLRNQLKIEIEPTITEFNYHYSAGKLPENTVNSEENIPQIRLDLEPVIDKNDYVTEIYELLEDEHKDETYSQNNENVEVYDIYTEERTESSSAFSDVEFIFEEEIYDKLEMQNNQEEFQTSNPGRKIRPNNTSKRRDTPKKRKYRCVPCQLEFQNLQEHKAHRTEVHDNKYPCSVCTNELKSLPGLHQHMKMHCEKPAFECEICQKPFNQKAHLKYHMNHHNNVRNFKCSECEKAFISKADLKVHMRCHTGQRPYVCNICGKDYLMMEHLKTHLLTHTGQVFLCNICNHKFATHKTLRMHVRTIHEDEPRFKCNFCSKPFRRKHHLEYHLRLHQKNVTFLDSPYEMVDDPNSDHNSTNEQELVDDPGFIALNDDIM